MAVCALLLGACGGGGGGVAGPPQGGAVDGGGGNGNGQGSIGIAITVPTGAGTMETPDESVIIEGTAAGAVVSVGWASDRGGEGEASGTTSWQTAAIDLETGENRITVTAEDGAGNTASASIVITRESAGTGSVTLSWEAPTEREDGSPLDNLAGYYIRYGRMSEVYDYEIELDNPGVLTYLVEGLQPGTWYFAAVAYDADGLESGLSNEVSRSVE